MQITEEMLQKQAEATVTKVDGYKQGYVEALAWVNQVLKADEKKEEVTA
jgi:hypothetical protein